MPQSNRKIEIITAAILFADIQGFSKIMESPKKQIIIDALADFVDRFLNNKNHFHYKPLGDGILILTHSSRELANIALNLRDFFVNEDWKLKGLDEDLKVRTAVNNSEVTVTITTKEDESKIFEVQDAEIDKAARIETIVEPDQVYCTETVKLQCEPYLNKVKFTRIGKVNLPKGYGKPELYLLTRKHDSIRVIPKMLFDNKNEITPIFECILEQLSTRKGGIETKVFNKDTSLKLTITTPSNHQATAQIWLADSPVLGLGIFYSAAFCDVGLENSIFSFNEYSQVINKDGKYQYSELLVEPFEQAEKTLCAEELAMSLWERIEGQLQS